MKIHEYQGKQILAKFGVRVPRGEVAGTPAEARAIAERIGPRVVVKAQIHAGGRGKGGGVKLAAGPAEAEALAARMIGMTLVTHQTGPEGKMVKLRPRRGGPGHRPGALPRHGHRPGPRGRGRHGLDRGRRRDREGRGRERPSASIKEYVDPAVGLLAFQARRLAFKLGLDGRGAQAGPVSFIAALYKAFEGTDASLAEINPLLVTKQGDVLALDAKMNFDDNALYRHPDIQAMRDLDEETPLEVEASKFNLNYIKLDGNVGCMVNGAGLAMATMDIIKYAGREPANFLDVGGGVTEEAVTNAFRILVSDPDVKGVLINIFGGIVRCDMIASGVVKAARALGTKIPVVIRLEGTNVDQGKKILAESGLAFSAADGMKEAAERIVGAGQVSRSIRSTP